MWANRTKVPIFVIRSMQSGLKPKRINRRPRPEQSRQEHTWAELGGAELRIAQFPSRELGIVGSLSEEGGLHRGLLEGSAGLCRVLRGPQDFPRVMALRFKIPPTPDRRPNPHFLKKRVSGS